MTIRLPFLLLFCVSNLLAQHSNLAKLSYAELDSLMYIEYDKGDFKKAIPYMQVAREKAKAEFGVQDSVYAIYTDNLGAFYFETGQYQQAELLFLESKAILEKTSTKEDPLYMVGLNNLAVLYEVMGHYSEAEALHLQAKDIRAKVLGTMHPDYARSLNNLAIVYNNMGKYSEAEVLYLDAKNIWEKTLGKEHQDYAASLANLAVLYEYMEHPEKSVQILLEAQDIYAKLYGKQHQHYVQCLNNLASAYENLGEDVKAEQMHLDAIAILKKDAQSTGDLYAFALNNLAKLYQKLKRYKEAEQLYLQSISIRAKSLGKEHSSYALSLVNLAGLYLEMNQLDIALDYCAASIAANSAQIDTGWADWITLDKFEYYSNRTLNFSIQTLLEIFHAQFEKTGDKTTLETKYQIAQKAMQWNEKIRNKLSGESDKLRVLAENTRFVRQGIETALLLKNKSYQIEAFSFAEMNKSILLADAVKGSRARALGDLPDDLAEQEIDLQNQLSELKKQQLQANDPETEKLVNEELTALNFQINTFLESLKNKYPKYHALKYENITPKAAEIQKLLDDKTVLLEYFLTDSVVYLFALTKTGFNLYDIGIQRQLFKDKVKTLRNALSNYTFLLKKQDEAYRDYSEAAYWFYKNLVQPGLAGTKGISKLNIITDGDLGHLPFEAFLVEPASQKKDYKNLHYLVNDYDISYNYSAALFAEARRNRKENLQAVSNSKILACASAYPVVDVELEQLRLPYFYQLRQSLNPLPAAQQEITQLSQKMQGDFLLGDAANERFFKEKAQNYSIIHLAMHGILEEKHPMLSSLAFTENRDSLEDNFLQAYEISRLKLNADLVVLSACETGFGKFEQGEGVVSLARAFMYAGVPSLVVSLWQVSDASTAVIMNDFYDNLARGMAKDAALRKAKMDYLQIAKGVLVHPAFWSPFILIGDESPIFISRKGGYLWWIVGGIGVLVLGGGAMAMRRKKE